jgi:hypothetical protein
MNLCEACKHWRPFESTVQYKQNMGECTKVVMWWNASDWDMEGNRCIIKPEYSDVKAFVQDGSDYSAALYTDKSFGCVMHKEKKT